MSNVFYAKDTDCSYIKKIRTNGKCSEAFFPFLMGETTEPIKHEIADIKWQELAVKFGLLSITVDSEFNNKETYISLHNSLGQLSKVTQIECNQLGSKLLHFKISKQIKNPANFYQAVDENFNIHSILCFNHPDNLKRLSHEWWHFIDYVRTIKPGKNFNIEQLEKQENVNSLREDISENLIKLIHLYSTQIQQYDLKEKVDYYFPNMLSSNKHLLTNNPYDFLFGEENNKEYDMNKVTANVLDKLNIASANGKEALKRFLLDILPEQTLISTAKNYDKSNKNMYESSINEVLARGFETWIENQLSANGEISLITNKKAYVSNLYPQKNIVFQQKDMWSNVLEEYKSHLFQNKDIINNHIINIRSHYFSSKNPSYTQKKDI